MARVKLHVPGPVVEEEVLLTQTDMKFLPSGSVLLDLMNSGGWAEGRVVNIVGDKSAGKTLLAIEACANFALLYRAEDIRYVEAEAAFDLPYARSMGMPKGAEMTEQGEIRTVEQLNNDLTKWLDARPVGRPCLYILDSLDALSDDAEMGRELGDATFGVGKAKMMSEMFRRLVGALATKCCTFIVISQIREKIGVVFGEKKTRAGGRALDFYASQIVWLSEIEKLKRTVTKVSRIVGVKVLARNRKNKAGLPFREAEFSILFNYGIDDELSMLDWLKKNKGEEYLVEGHSVTDYIEAIKTARGYGERVVLRGLHAEIKTAVTARWMEIEAALAPTMSKYG